MEAWDAPGLPVRKNTHGIHMEEKMAEKNTGGIGATDGMPEERDGGAGRNAPQEPSRQDDAPSGPQDAPRPATPGGAAGGTSGAPDAPATPDGAEKGTQAEPGIAGSAHGGPQDAPGLAAPGGASQDGAQKGAWAQSGTAGDAAGWTQDAPGGMPGAGSGAGDAPRQPAGQGFFDWIRGLGMARSATDRWVGGVSGAIASRLGWNPLIIRIVFLALAFICGLGVALYAIAWLLLPDERDGRIILESAIREGDCARDFWIALVALLASFVVPSVNLLAAVVAAVVLAVWYAHDSNVAGIQSDIRAPRTAAGTYNVARPQFRPTGATAGAAAGSPRIVHRRKPAGTVVVASSAGAILLALAVILILGAAHAFDGMTPTFLDTLAIWSVASLAFLGAVTIVAGIIGRKSGGLIPLAIVMAVIACCGVAFHTVASIPIDGIAPRAAAVRVSGGRRTLGSNDFDRMTGGVHAEMTTLTIDLSDWSASHSSECPTGELPVWAIASDVTVILPRGCGASANYSYVIVDGVDIHANEYDDYHDHGSWCAWQGYSWYDGSVPGGQDGLSDDEDNNEDSDDEGGTDGSDSEDDDEDDSNDSSDADGAESDGTKQSEHNHGPSRADRQNGSAESGLTTSPDATTAAFAVETTERGKHDDGSGTVSCPDSSDLLSIPAIVIGSLRVIHAQE